MLATWRIIVSLLSVKRSGKVGTRIAINIIVNSLALVLSPSSTGTLLTAVTGCSRMLQRRSTSS